MITKTLSNNYFDFLIGICHVYNRVLMYVLFFNKLFINYLNTKCLMT